MAFMKWNESLSVKINSFDEEHKIIIEMINYFYDHIKDKSNDEIISNSINKMKDYTQFHFKNEEKYMVKYNYPDYISHKKEHDKFIAKVGDLEKRFNSGGIIITFEITSFLKDWLKTHINGTDKKYSNFFIEHGVR